MSIEKPKATKHGVHINGWSVSWHVVAAAVLVIGNAFVAQYRIGELEKQMGTIAEQARKVEVIDNRIKNNTRSIEYHRRYEHGNETDPD